MGEQTTARIPLDIKGVLTQICQVGIEPCQKMQGTGEKLHQAPDSLHAPPRAGKDSDYGGRQLPPPLFPRLRHVFDLGGYQPLPH